MGNYNIVDSSIKETNDGCSVTVAVEPMIEMDSTRAFGIFTGSVNRLVARETHVPHNYPTFTDRDDKTHVTINRMHMGPCRGEKGQHFDLMQALGRRIVRDALAILPQ